MNDSAGLRAAIIKNMDNVNIPVMANSAKRILLCRVSILLHRNDSKPLMARTGDYTHRAVVSTGLANCDATSFHLPLRLSRTSR